MSNSLKEIDFHITDFCNGHCPMCYATEEGMERTNGDLDTLKLVVHNAIKNGEVERFVMVGGDPCEHPNLVELLKYIKEEGRKYNVKTKTIVLSNTHDYKENGQPVDIKDIAQYIDEMDVTVHGSTAEEHDRFNGVPGSYEHVMENLQKFAEVKTDEQEICAIINIMPHTIRPPKHLEEIMMATALKLNGNLNSFGIQRIAPSGRADGKVMYFIEKQEVKPLMTIFHKMIQEKGYNVDFIDVFPWCQVDKEYRYMLPKGGCNWGTEVCAVYMDGSVSRCAMSSNKLSKRMTELDTPEKWKKFWNTESELIDFRKKLHLDERCKACEMIDDCGGGCTLARQSGDPYNISKRPIDPIGGKVKPEFTRENYVVDTYPKPGHDYLRKDREIKKKRRAREIMNNVLTDEQIEIIKNNEWIIFSTADLNNNPRAIIVIPSKVEKNRIILSNIQMNKSIKNIKNNNKCFINIYSKENSDMQIKIDGIAIIYEEGDLFTEIKEYEETNNLPDDLKVHSIIVVEFKNIETTHE